MAIFTVIAQPDQATDRLAPAVAQSFVGLNYKLAEGVWLVAGRGTAEDISEKLQLTEGGNGSAVVTEVGSYFGFANPAIWSWIKTNWEGGALG